MNHDALIFDIDGTLWNAASSSAKGWNLGFKELGIDVREISGADIETVAGKPFEECVTGLFPDLVLTKYPTILEDLGKHEKRIVKTEGGKLYEGVFEGLQALKKKYDLYLVSNCQDWYMNSFLTQTGLEEMFVDRECYGRTLKSKGENLKSIVLRNNLSRPVYIGDTTTDAKAANKADIDFLHASYGFGESEKEWKKVDSFSEIVELYCK
jgi:phosphoglycolate phosphatase